MKIHACSLSFILLFVFSFLLSFLLYIYLLPSAPEQRVPRVSPGLYHQQPGRASRPGQQTQRDLHTGQQHRPGQTVPLLPLQEEHPEVNKGGCERLLFNFCINTQNMLSRESMSESFPVVTFSHDEVGD